MKRQLIAIVAALTALAALAAIGCAPAVPGEVTGPEMQAAAAAAAPAASGSLRLTVRLAPGGAEVLDRAVSPDPVQRRDPYRNEATFYRVYAADGRVLAERGFKLEAERRVEIPNADGSLGGERVQEDAPIVTLQIPRFAEAAVVRLYRKGAPEPELLGEVRP